MNLRRLKPVELQLFGHAEGDLWNLLEGWRRCCRGGAMTMFAAVMENETYLFIQKTDFFYVDAIQITNYFVNLNSK